MKTLVFYKYQGTGNDFIVIDNRFTKFVFSSQEIAFLCNRKYGIGADGLMLYENVEDYDFKMVYYNADGQEGSMCGNGGRCLVAFAAFRNPYKKRFTFLAVDGEHVADIIVTDEKDKDIVSLQMKDVEVASITNDSYFTLNTGSPHLIQLVASKTELQNIDVDSAGKAIRYNEVYKKDGINVNFAALISDNTLQMRTYERGVEAETESCGTGAVAVAIAAHYTQIVTTNEITIHTQGGELTVHFQLENGVYKNVYLQGEVKKVFQGSILLG